MQDHLPPAVIDFFMVLTLSSIGGLIAIGRRIQRGHHATFIWLLTEYLTAILSGYLMYTAFPYLSGWLPDWITSPIAIAFAAHSGGRVIQACEGAMVGYLERIFIRSS